MIVISLSAGSFVTPWQVTGVPGTTLAASMAFLRSAGSEVTLLLTLAGEPNARWPAGISYSPCISLRSYLSMPSFDWWTALQCA